MGPIRWGGVGWGRGWRRGVSWGLLGAIHWCNFGLLTTIVCDKVYSGRLQKCDNDSNNDDDGKRQRERD